MPLPAPLLALAGSWTGDNTIWLYPGSEPMRSSAAAQLSVDAQGQALSLRYQWADGDKPQSGILLLVGERKTDAVVAAWTDSWHFGHMLMSLKGNSAATSASALGAYAAPSGPDWGWRISLEALEGGACRLRMDNIKPGEAEVLAVEMPFRRTG